MLGLADYASSDEEEVEVHDKLQAAGGTDDGESCQAPVEDEGENHKRNKRASEPNALAMEPAAQSRPPALAHRGEVSLSSHSVQSTPMVGPSMPQQGAEQNFDDAGGPPSSPYSAERTALRSLTMPPTPNFDIPDSPPGTPPAGPTKNIAHFLKLKKQGVHFNTKIEDSSALRNPALLQKLMEFAGINETDQYASALPDDIAWPTQFPAWAYADELNMAQADVTRRKETEKSKMPRRHTEFVKASDEQTLTTGSTGEGRPEQEELRRSRSRSPREKRLPSR